MSCRNPGREHTRSAEHLEQGCETTVEALPFSLSSDPLLQVNLFSLTTLTYLTSVIHMVENRAPVSLKFHLFPFQPGRGRIHLHSHSHLQMFRKACHLTQLCQILNPSRRGEGYKRPYKYIVMKISQWPCKFRKKWQLFIKRRPFSRTEMLSRQSH